MLKLEAPVTAIPKIGKTYQARLKRLEIETVKDLLYHFPFRYDDYSVTKQINEVKIGDTITVKATLKKIDNIYTKYRKKLTRAKISDKTGTLEVIWFNQHYLKRTLKVGEAYYFSGKINWFSRKPSFISPQFEPTTNTTQLNTGKLVSIYPETARVSSKWLRTRINDVLDILEPSSELAEFLPKKTLKKHSLETFSKALKHFHFPQNKAEITHAKKRFAFEELFVELLKIEWRKRQWNKDLKAVRITYDTPQQDRVKGFIQNLPFTLTPSQKKAVEEILKDLTQKHPMNRLLEGDVGSGKTIVAIIAAYLMILNEYKVLYMAPTEILAKQHYQTFESFLEEYGVRVELVTGATRGKGEINPTSKDATILIGTHALLHLKNPLENVGLVIIDEQHRFGVEQRAQLSNTAINRNATTPHTLTMTATPIPRTLALTLYGDLDISTLKENPNKEKKITTRVVPEKMRKSAYKWIKTKGEPTFIVCPLIEESNHETMENVKAATKEFEKLKKGPLKNVPIGLLHGRMKAKEKHEVVDKFKEGKIKVLVSTPVIEVGIDIPEATIIVIESAERYGLASLHQLRGRVGRGKKEGFCFTFISNNSKMAYKRLKHLERINNGLKLAEIDMKMRGQGDIYGTMQHGFKKFKVADIYDVELLETAKAEAQSIFPKLDDFPKLKERAGGNISISNN